MTVDEQPPTALRRIVGEISAAPADYSRVPMASTIDRLIHDGSLPVDSRLPPCGRCRGVDVSPTTVSEAWNTLAGVEAISAAAVVEARSCAPVGTGDTVAYRQISEHSVTSTSTSPPARPILRCCRISGLSSHACRRQDT
ncbi:MAG: hypothetical protein WKF58_02615 [Ilumatobacteraceae bacterium]